MDTLALLKQFGINEKSAKVYLAILELGICTASKVADKAKIPRTLVYDIIKKLLAQGLLKNIHRSGKNYFSAISPAELLELQEQKVQRLKKALPELNQLSQGQGRKPQVFYYEGKNGIDYINKDSLKQKGEIIGFTSPLYVTYQQKYISKEYASGRTMLGRKARVIGEQAPEIMELKRKDGDFLRSTKILPRELFSSNIELGICQDKVYIVDYKDEFGFIIESESVAKTLKMIFNMIWNNAEGLR